MLFVSSSLSVAAATPQLAPERVIFQTPWGDMVFALYPEVAPRHVAQILALVQAGAYDGTHFHRVEPNFVLQLSTIEQRLKPLSAAQQQLHNNLPAEFSASLKHQKGILSMARWKALDSATSSFSILLSDAPHLDGQYTIFGHLESGATTINRMLSVGRRGVEPCQRLTVLKAYLHRDIEQYYEKFAQDPAKRIGLNLQPQSDCEPDDTLRTAGHGSSASLEYVAIGLLLAISLTGLAGLLLYDYLEKSYLLSLLMLNVFIAGFGLLVFVTPVGHERSWVASLFFLGLLGMFKLMNRFESKN
jgi:cyclophilin family peptidyl-prolyl cis-trans isomerase